MIASVQARLKATFDDEVKHLLLEKRNIEKELDDQARLIRKLIRIGTRQELDTYDPNIELPPEFVGYLRHVEEYLKRDGLLRCSACHKDFQRHKRPREQAQNEDAVLKMALGLEDSKALGSAGSSRIGTKQLALDFSSEAVSERLRTIFDLEYDMQRRRREELQGRIFKSLVSQEAGMSYPTVPISHEQMAELQQGVAVVVEDLEAQVKELTADVDGLFAEKEMQGHQLTQLTEYSEETQSLYYDTKAKLE